jgi:hypothetical protein
MRPAESQSSPICSPDYRGAQSGWRLPSGRTLLDHVVRSHMAAPALALALKRLSQAKRIRKAGRTR